MNQPELNPHEYPLDVGGSAFRQLVAAVTEQLAAHLDSLPQQPTWNLDDAEAAAREVIEPLPESASEFSELVRRVVDRYALLSFNAASPGYLAYVPGGGLPQAALADLIGDTINRYVGVWTAAPALAQIEAVVVRWFAEIIGYPRQAGGFLTSGGSLATWSALVTAREVSGVEDLRLATVYFSDQAHHCVPKAARLIGLPEANIRLIASDEQFRIRVGELEDRLGRDRRDGFTPLAIVGQAGTTNTGAVDDLPALAALAARLGVWLHVDAAYGGFFALTERGRRALRGIEQADSVVLDPHKGLFLPYGNGCLLVRNREHLLRTHALLGEYLPEMQADEDFVDFCRISPELSRPFRGLRAWLPLKMYGAATFRRYLDEKLDLALHALDRLEQLSRDLDGQFEIVARPQLTTLAFRLRPAGLDEEQLESLNRRLLEAINAPRRVYLTPTVVRGQFVIRICIVSFRTHQDRVDECLEIIEQATRSLLAAGGT